MSIAVIIILILLGLFGVSSSTADGPDCAGDDCITTVTMGAWMPVEINGISGVIVADADGGMFMQAEEYWSPEIQDVERAEEAITAQEGVLGHFRQYVGYIDNGERKIYINGFTDPMGRDWLSEPVMVEDGGEAFFGATFNVDTGTLENFSFNGEA